METQERGATMHTSQQSPRSLLRLPLPIPTPLKLALLARAPACPRLQSRCCCCCCCCRPAGVGIPYERQQNGWVHAKTAGDCKRRCRIMTNRIKFAYRSACSIFFLADKCSTRCDLFKLVPRCQVSRFQRPLLTKLHGFIISIQVLDNVDMLTAQSWLGTTTAGWFRQLRVDFVRLLIVSGWRKLHTACYL